MTAPIKATLFALVVLAAAPAHADEACPGVRTARTGGEALAYEERGNELTRERNFDKAISCYSEAIKAAPREARFYTSRAVTRFYKGDLDGAIADYTKALELRPATSTYTQRGIAFRYKGDFAAAIADQTKAISLTPNDPMAHQERCRARVQAGEGKPALADCNKAIEINPTAPRNFETRGYAHLRAGDYAAAIADFNIALELYEDYSEALFQRGIARRKLGQTTQGNADIKRATELDPKVAAKMKKLGIVP